MKYLLLLLIPFTAFMNRVRGGLRIIPGRTGEEAEVTKGIPSTILALLLSLPLLIYPTDNSYLLYGLTLFSFISAFWGVTMSHGQWFPGSEDDLMTDDPDSFFWLYKLIRGYVSPEVGAFLMLSLTGLVSTFGLGISLYILGMPILGTAALLTGFSKGIVYRLGQKTPTIRDQLHSGIEISEMYCGIVLGALASVLILILL